MLTRRLLAPVVIIAAVIAAANPAAAHPPRAPATTPVLRLDGIGPLTLGLQRVDAIAKHWLGGRAAGCKLGGPPYPITYRFTGYRAPDGIDGTAEFRGERLRNLSFTGGVTTAAGVTPGATSATRMVLAYRAAGYRVSARYDDTFQGTFVVVKRGNRQVLGGFAEGRLSASIAILGIPYVPVCE